MAGYEMAIQQWREGERRLADAPPEQQRALYRVVEQILAELRRRLGGAFTAAELVALYDRGTSWCLDLAYRTEPEAPWAWDERTVADAAFARYIRGAVDFGGGRRIRSDAR